VSRLNSDLNERSTKKNKITGSHLPAIKSIQMGGKRTKQQNQSLRWKALLNPAIKSALLYDHRGVVLSVAGNAELLAACCCSAPAGFSTRRQGHWNAKSDRPTKDYL